MLILRSTLIIATSLFIGFPASAADNLFDTNIDFEAEFNEIERELNEPDKEKAAPTTEDKAFTEFVTEAVSEVKVAKVENTPKTSKSVNRQPASVAWEGFKRLKRNCAMHSSPDLSSKEVLQLKKGKKLWLEASGQWMMGFRKKGVGFISNDCF